ncbi:50S ribosomal protein L10 [Methylophaga lonarensis MPL]|uniref:Large ribosomal subunit protein uL10 n=1 Tax=Methylophaga lonarensis MPL TaxID=1286106 RepID=M7P1Q5_9GAMM|nr:50S ribosomal protein L10 [Methylophaga lonarensis]EMR13392.1 50S ribosomal protein L10 [Methylophaga lonarensis MPL]
MALNLEGKKAVVAEVAEVAQVAHSAVAAEYRGLSVAKMTELRVAARNQNVYLRVVRNTLARRAVEGTDFACMQEGMTGPLVYGFSMEDPGAVARVMADFAKENKQLEIKLVSLGGQLLPASELDRLAKMPTKEQAISMFMGTLKAPIEKFVRTLQAPTSKMVRTFAAVRDAKQAA